MHANFVQRWMPMTLMQHHLFWKKLLKISQGILYDALISRRVYKLPCPHSKAAAIIQQGKGRYFGPDIVDVFLEISENFIQWPWSLQIQKKISRLKFNLLDGNIPGSLKILFETHE